MSRRKQYRPWTPEQPFLLPPSPMDWLPKGHLADFILDVVSELDLKAIETSIQAKDARGNRPYPPEMMVALLLYGYCVGVLSSRKLGRATYEDVAFRVLAGGEQPHFTTINTFRNQHLEALRTFFLQLCQTAGLVKRGHVALDGTKVQANASKHKAMSDKRMLKSELELTEQIDALLARADEADTREDERFGKEQRDEDLPAELRRRESRLEKIREAKKRLEAEAAEARARALREQAAKARERSASATDEANRNTTCSSCGGGPMPKWPESAAGAEDSGLHASPEGPGGRRVLAVGPYGTPVWLRAPIRPSRRQPRSANELRTPRSL